MQIFLQQVLGTYLCLFPLFFSSSEMTVSVFALPAKYSSDISSEGPEFCSWLILTAPEIASS